MYILIFILIVWVFGDTVVDMAPPFDNIVVAFAHCDSSAIIIDNVQKSLKKR